MLRWDNLEIAETIDEVLDPRSSGLIMWDFAKGLVNRAFNRDEFIATAAKLVNGARECGVPIFYARQSDVTWPEVGAGLIRMRLRPNITAERIAQYQKMSVNRPETPQGEFVDEVAPKDGDVIFNKFMPSAFLGTDLEWRLRARGVKTLVVAGISMATGVDGTAREALNRGYYAVVVRDASSATSESRYNNSLAVCEEIHDVCTTEEVVAAWRRGMNKA